MKNLCVVIGMVSIFAMNSSCKKEAKNPEFIDKPVVQSYLEIGQIPTVNVSRLIAFSSDAKFSSDDITNLNITISSNNTTYTLQSQGNGNYAAVNPSFAVIAGSIYNLNFTYNDQNVFATTIIPSEPTGYWQSVSSMSITPRHSGSGGFSSGSLNPDPVKLTWSNSDNSYYLVLAEVIDPNAKLIDTTAGAKPRAFKSTPIQSNTSQINYRQFQYYGMHRLVLFHLNPDYANLYNNTSTNSTNLTNSSTSVVNGAGIFTGLNSDTLFINILKP